MTFGPFSCVRANKSIGKRLMLSFPKSIDRRVMAIALPSEGHLSFGVEPAGDQYELVLERLGEETLEGSVTQTLAVFDNERDALRALGRIRRALTRPLRRALGWATVALIVAFVLQWLIMTGSSVRQAPPGSAPMGVSQNQGQLSPEQLTLLQQAISARGAADGGALPPPPLPAAPAPTQSAPTSAASVYENPAAPQDPTGGALSQLNNSR